MQVQILNPLNFRCASNQATPDYVVYDDFRQFVAYGLMCCWTSYNPEDPNDECCMPRPITREDVKELRGYFLDLVETVITSLWKKQCSPGDGNIDGEFQRLYIVDEDSECVSLVWTPRLDDDSIMFELHCDYSHPESVWLGYKGIEDRANVLKVLTEARATIDDEVWDELVQEASKTPA